ncbi:hypothetical protein LLH06_00445 [Mucilaginibacter daejeonensis]|uniref:hypothetical protein n=1 Tax=Mucilaginibacter daejeonensis TaxID=398049 RepID=UPI001D175A03|nr:hypothetical protein [Mucilaginibacter daejeonensis]UEG53446.1 hypothetical protein LLH06_00445 [Mucilaginibacter daejeonensis]
MKNLIKVIAVLGVILLIAYPKTDYGQNRSRLVQKVTSISRALYDNLSIEEAVLDTLCFNSTVFCKFHLNSEGKINDLNIGDAPSKIKGALVEAFKKTNHALSLSNSEILKYKKKLLIVPVVLYYGHGCMISNAQLNDDQASVTRRLSISYERLNSTMLKSNYAVEDLLKDGDINLAEMECIFLSPISKGYRSH